MGGGQALSRFGLRPRIARLLDVSVVEVHRWFDKTALAEGMAVPAWLGHLAALEQAAAEIWTYEPVVVPGLLQTAAYARAVQHADSVVRTDAEMDRRVEHRLARQQVLAREPDPLVICALMDESVLWRVAGDHAVMAGQLEHLAAVAERPNIDVRVLPVDPGEFSAGWGSFTLITAPGWTEPYMACVYDQAGPHYLDRAHEVDAHIALFSHLRRVALSSAESVDHIRSVAKERFRP